MEVTPVVNPRRPLRSARTGRGARRGLRVQPAPRIPSTPRTRPVARLAALLLVACGLALPGGAAAQSLSVRDPLTDYVRILEITRRGPIGSGFTRHGQIPAGWPADSASHPWAERLARIRRPGAGDAGGAQVQVIPTGALLRSSLNTGHPFGGNDGALWQGRGLSGAVEAGFEVRWKGVTARVQPEALWAQNVYFDIVPAARAGLPEVAYPWRVIDLPQRPGREAWSRVGLGESELRVDARGVTFGVGHRARWWGPGVRNAILLSDNAGGFPHAFVGTRRPVDIGIGTLDVLYLHGGLKQSDWFDEAERRNERFLTGLLVGLSPDWPRGLSLGGARMFYGRVAESGRSFEDLLLPLTNLRKKAFVSEENPTGDDELDQMLSLFMRWVLPESGFEVYVEWARTDHAWDFRDLILEPEHAQGRTLGLRHSTELSGDRLVVLGLEVTDISKTPTFQVRINPTWYQHWFVRQGYTHRGQLLGASVGPGGSAQAITADLYDPRGRLGLLLERRVHENDAYYALATPDDLSFCCHDVSFSAGPRLTYFRDDLELEGRTVLTRRLNRYFVRGDDVWNLHLGVSARWRPGG